MFCSNCGSQIPDGAKVCPGCGTPVASYAADAKASAHNSSPDLKNQATEFIGGSINSAANSVKKRDFKSLLKNKLVIAAAALIVVIVVLIIVIANVAGSSSAPFAVAENQINQFYTEDYTTVLFYNGKQIKTELDGKYVNVYSNNAKTSVYVTNNDMLYALSGDNLKEVSDDCQILGVAGFGSAVFYTSDDALYVYDNGNSKRITDLEGDPRSFVISPDGSACAWTVYDEEYYGFAWEGSKVSELGKMSIVYSVTNGGDLIYCATENGKLGYIKGLSDEIETIKPFNSVTAFSADNRQVMFENGSSTFVFSVSMDEPVKVDKGIVRVLLPENGYYTANNFDNFVGVCGSDINRYIRKGDEYPDPLTLANDSYTSMISADGKNILYYSNGKMIKRDTQSEQANKITVAKNIYSDFAADANFNNIFYINNSYELVYSNGKESGITTVYDNGEVYGIALSTSGVCSFIYDHSSGEGSAAYSANGGGKQKCGGVSNLDQFYNNTMTAQKYIFALNSDDELYVSSDGKNFTNTKIVTY